MPKHTELQLLVSWKKTVPWKTRVPQAFFVGDFIKVLLSEQAEETGGEREVASYLQYLLGSSSHAQKDRIQIIGQAPPAVRDKAARTIILKGYNAHNT